MIKNKDVVINVSELPNGKKWRIYWTVAFDIKGIELFRLEKQKDFSDWSLANSFYQKKKGRAI